MTVTLGVRLRVASGSPPINHQVLLSTLTNGAEQTWITVFPTFVVVILSTFTSHISLEIFEFSKALAVNSICLSSTAVPDHA